MTEYYIQHNILNKNDIFIKYHALLLAMNGIHGLRPHNRKFYYNVFNRDFEPIYYDGDLFLYDNLLYSDEIEFPIFLKETNKQVFENLKKQIDKLINTENFKKNLLKRLTNTNEYFVYVSEKNKHNEPIVWDEEGNLTKDAPKFLQTIING